MQRLLKKDLLPFESVIAQTSVAAHQSEPSSKDSYWFVQELGVPQSWNFHGEYADKLTIPYHSGDPYLQANPNAASEAGVWLDQLMDRCVEMWIQTPMYAVVYAHTHTRTHTHTHAHASIMEFHEYCH